MAQVVFLRGVNVGGRRIFRPRALADQLRDLDVVNIGAAGTFVVRKAVAQTALRAELLRRLPFEPEILICSGREILKAIAGDPFAGQPSGPSIVPFVTVFAKRSNVVLDLPLEMPDEEWVVRLIAIQDRFAFGLYRRHMRAISYLGRLEKRIGVPVTTRNWNTMQSIMKVLNSEL